ncbi:hypothetical protein [Morganella morganii]|uniref:hypothetical protein n=1 Tax=Morganella morganii TaxID=582 RepID=UPI0002911F11|nr:hypothetical protein [Morganella morganii]AVK38469.1 hypothetical protein CSB69_3417 [Morganella morganii]ELO7536944.1 hypothetical protein [Morganella morganii]EMP52785.1 putative bacteriophage protein [Morganella morganii SC01]MBO8063477.1 hypothetical protein [Morganella morganii]HDU8428678.1 hypothetical protein [Morganella morganii]
MKEKLPFIDAGLLRAALTLIAAKDDSQPVTKAVHINGEFIESTNGHALVRMKHNAHFYHDIVVQFNHPVPDDAEFTEIKVLDDGLCVAVYYREEKEAEFVPFGTSALTRRSETYPDFDIFLKREFVKNALPPVSAKYLALPCLMFGFGVVDAMCTEDGKAVLFNMDPLANEIYGDPQLVAMAVMPEYFDACRAAREEGREDE